ncbi:MAG: phosphoheptose isomerase [Bdellovibrio sp.]|nr:MAG: phosphoheptose isomerase [Bdellovibrio sp.]
MSKRNTSDIDELLKKGLAESARNVSTLQDSQLIQEQILRAAHLIVETYSSGGSLFACGNGGSAADAQHLVAEFVAKLQRDRSPIRALALTTDSSVLTAIGNDYGYDLIFHRQIHAMMSPKDILLAISTSGKSPNILRGLQACKDVGAPSILLTGRDGGGARELADCTIIVPGTSTAHIQECHMIVYHLLGYLVEVQLVEHGLVHYRDANS